MRVHCSSLFSASSGPRSEEHTSELQSRLHLVCRLLLEKKKRKTTIVRALEPIASAVVHRLRCYVGSQFHHSRPVLHLLPNAISACSMRLLSLADRDSS